jgi:hypothetical protein
MKFQIDVDRQRYPAALCKTFNVPADGQTQAGIFEKRRMQ